MDSVATELADAVSDEADDESAASLSEIEAVDALVDEDADDADDE